MDGNDGIAGEEGGAETKSNGDGEHCFGEGAAGNDDDYDDDEEYFSDEILVVVGSRKGGLARRVSTGGLARIEEHAGKSCALM